MFVVEDGGSPGGLQNLTVQVEILVLPTNAMSLDPFLILSMPLYPCVSNEGL